MLISSYLWCIQCLNADVWHKEIFTQRTKPKKSKEWKNHDYVLDLHLRHRPNKKIEKEMNAVLVIKPHAPHISRTTSIHYMNEPNS